MSAMVFPSPTASGRKRCFGTEAGDEMDAVGVEGGGGGGSGLSSTFSQSLSLSQSPFPAKRHRPSEQGLPTAVEVAGAAPGFVDDDENGQGRFGIGVERGRGGAGAGGGGGGVSVGEGEGLGVGIVARAGQKRRSFIAEEEEQKPYGAEVCDDLPAGKRNKSELVVYTRDGRGNLLDSAASPTTSSSSAAAAAAAAAEASSVDFTSDQDFLSSNSLLRDLHFMRGARSSQRRDRDSFGQDSLLSIDDSQCPPSHKSYHHHDYHNQQTLQMPSSRPLLLLHSPQAPLPAPVLLPHSNVLTLLRDLPRAKRCEADYQRRRAEEEERGGLQHHLSSPPGLLQISNGGVQSKPSPGQFVMSFRSNSHQVDDNDAMTN